MTNLSLCGRAEGPIGLGPVDPNALAKASGVDAIPHGVNLPGAVAVRDHARVGIP